MANRATAASTIIASSCDLIQTSYCQHKFDIKTCFAFIIQERFATTLLVVRARPRNTDDARSYDTCDHQSQCRKLCSRPRVPFSVLQGDSGALLQLPPVNYELIRVS